MMKNYHEEVFGKRPVKIEYLYAYEQKLSKKEKTACYHYFYRKAICEWPSLKKPYKRFLVNLVKHDWQRFLDYSHTYTIFGSLQCPLKYLREEAKLIHLSEQYEGKAPCSGRHFGFAMNHSFKNDRLKRSIDSVRKWVSRYPLISPLIGAILDFIEELREEEGRKK